MLCGIQFFQENTIIIIQYFKTIFPPFATLPFRLTNNKYLLIYSLCFQTILVVLVCELCFLSLCVFVLCLKAIPCKKITATLNPRVRIFSLDLSALLIIVLFSEQICHIHGDQAGLLSFSCNGSHK